MNDLTYDVHIWATRTMKGSTRTTYQVRWKVAAHERTKTFQTRKLAESFRSKLTTATREGVAFDPRSGFPEPEARQLLSVSWYEHAREFVAMKWPGAAPRSRRSIAEALATVTPVLMRDGRGRPSGTELRRVLYQWSFAVGTDADDETHTGHEWLTANSVPLIDLQNPAIVRQCLDTIATTLDGRPAAPTTVARKRAVFYGALRYAVELGRLQSHPIEHVQWRAPRSTDELDRRVVINPTQAVRLLAAVRMIDPAMEAFFACMYYAAMRPGEVLHLRRDHCTLPPTGWGQLLLTGSTQRTGLTWGDGLSTMEDRELKHRSQKATRPVPACPELVAILHNHLTTYGTGPDGRLFVTRAGAARTPLPGDMARPVSGSSYGNTWRRARAAALTTREAASPMARRPYDLRHACVSLWLNAGVPAAQVAEWAGHSVAVLLRVYAQCLDGQGDAARLRIETALAQAHPGTTPQC